MSPKIQAILDTALEQVRAALLEEASQAVRQALGGGEGGGSTRPRAAKRASAAPTRTRAKGAKRTPEELEALTKNLLAAIKKTPGQRIEQIGKSIDVSTKELALPIAKLFDAKAIKSTGQRRATKYFPR